MELIALQTRYQAVHHIEIAERQSELQGGDALFIVSCSEKISRDKLDCFEKTFVLHASALPKGRGWSPHIWQVIEGSTEITVSMIEADDSIDTGDVWKTEQVKIPKHFLWDEINKSLFQAEINLICYAIEHFQELDKTPQNSDVKPTWYNKRHPSDSQLDIDASIAEQFDLIRICDPSRYPAFFTIHGCKYRVILEKIGD